MGGGDSLCGKKERKGEKASEHPQNLPLACWNYELGDNYQIFVQFLLY
jgi:hypothetical protein